MTLASFRQLLHVDPGFDVKGVVTAATSVPQSMYRKDSDASTLMDRALTAIRAIPGVTAAGATTTVPWSGDHSDSVILAEGYVMKPGECYLLNDPWHGGSHLPDLTIVLPVFGDGALRFLTVVRAHQSDIGGATHGAYHPAAFEIWQEGVVTRPLPAAR